MRRLLFFLLILSILTSFSSVYAAPSDVTDTFEQETLIEEYNLEEAKFIQKFSDGRFFKTSIPNGQITPGMAKVEFPKSGLSWSLEVDGKAVPYSSGDYLFKTGVYVFTVLSPDSGIYGEYRLQIAEVSAATSPDASAVTVELLYKYNKDRFNYVFENGRAFSATVPNGGITGYGVKLWLDSGLICLLTKDGNVIRYNSGDILTDDGYYHMLVISPMVVDIPDLSRYSNQLDGAYRGTDEDYDGADLDELEKELSELTVADIEQLQALTPGETYQTTFAFRIITRPTRLMPVFNAPVGFEIDSVSSGGKTFAPSNKYFHRFMADGDYIISLKDVSGDSPSRFVLVTIDTTPPNVTLSGVTKGYSSNGPVSLQTDDKDAVITVFHNGIETSPQDVYKGTGRYNVSVSDTAGNVASLNFEITYAPSRTLVLAGILTALLATAGYVIYAKRSMTVK